MRLQALALSLSVLAAAPGSAAAVPELAVTQLRESPFGAGITLVEPSGAGRAVLTRHAGWMDMDPAWSPDGRRIAFARSTNGERSWNLYVMRRDGGGLRRITRGRFDERPAWSPDGRWIAYQALDGVIRLVRPDGSGDRAVPGSRDSAWPWWAPDGRIAFTSGDHVVVARTDGSHRARLVRGREPDWSPDGRTIAYTGPEGGVYTAPARGGRGRLIHSGMQPTWSPDGRRIAFARAPSSGGNAVWVMNRDGSGARRVLPDAHAPDWRP